jgi:hypothetical protein
MKNIKALAYAFLPVLSYFSYLWFENWEYSFLLRCLHSSFLGYIGAKIVLCHEIEEERDSLRDRLREACNHNLEKQTKIFELLNQIDENNNTRVLHPIECTCEQCNEKWLTLGQRNKTLRILEDKE